MKLTQISVNCYRNDDVDIKLDYATKEVVVIENGKEIFRRPKTPQNIELGQAIYFGAKYKEMEE